MAKIYSAPEGIEKPKFDYRNIKEFRQAEEGYINQIKEWVKKYTTDKVNANFIGEMISIPHADGKACYIVQSLKPVELIHLAIGDEWDSPHADLLTAKRIKEMVNGDRMLNQLFQKKLTA